jgi:hydrogenase expression/formation protein HypC
MCLAVPMRVVEINGETGTVEAGGMQRKVGLMLLDGVRPGDYVIVHAGFAIQIIDESEARKTLALFEELERSV